MPALQNRTSIGSPFSRRQNSPICLLFVMSMSLRSVPITFQPSSAYCRASSLPRPRPAPVIRIVGMSG
jgi:hypothetical protein